MVAEAAFAAFEEVRTPTEVLSSVDLSSARCDELTTVLDRVLVGLCRSVPEAN